MKKIINYVFPISQKQTNLNKQIQLQNFTLILQNQFMDYFRQSLLYPTSYSHNDSIKDFLYLYSLNDILNQPISSKDRKQLNKNYQQIDILVKRNSIMALNPRKNKKNFSAALAPSGGHNAGGTTKGVNKQQQAHNQQIQVAAKQSAFFQQINPTDVQKNHEENIFDYRLHMKLSKGQQIFKVEQVKRKQKKRIFTGKQCQCCGRQVAKNHKCLHSLCERKCAKYKNTLNGSRRDSSIYSDSKDENWSQDNYDDEQIKKPYTQSNEQISYNRHRKPFSLDSMQKPLANVSNQSNQKNHYSKSPRHSSNRSINSEPPEHLLQLIQKLLTQQMSNSFTYRVIQIKQYQEDEKQEQYEEEQRDYEEEILLDQQQQKQEINNKSINQQINQYQMIYEEAQFNNNIKNDNKSGIINSDAKQRNLRRNEKFTDNNHPSKNQNSNQFISNLKSRSRQQNYQNAKLEPHEEDQLQRQLKQELMEERQKQRQKQNKIQNQQQKQKQKGIMDAMLKNSSSSPPQTIISYNQKLIKLKTYNKDSSQIIQIQKDNSEQKKNSMQMQQQSMQEARIKNRSNLKNKNEQQLQEEKQQNQLSSNQRQNQNGEQQQVNNQKQHSQGNEEVYSEIQDQQIDENIQQQRGNLKDFQIQRQQSSDSDRQQKNNNEKYSKKDDLSPPIIQEVQNNSLDEEIDDIMKKQLNQSRMVKEKGFNQNNPSILSLLSYKQNSPKKSKKYSTIPASIVYSTQIKELDPIIDQEQLADKQIQNKIDQDKGLGKGKGRGMGRGQAIFELQLQINQEDKYLMKQNQKESEDQSDQDHKKNQQTQKISIQGNEISYQIQASSLLFIPKSSMMSPSTPKRRPMPNMDEIISKLKKQQYSNLRGLGRGKVFGRGLGVLEQTIQIEKQHENSPIDDSQNQQLQIKYKCGRKRVKRDQVSYQNDPSYQKKEDDLQRDKFEEQLIDEKQLQIQQQKMLLDMDQYKNQQINSQQNQNKQKSSKSQKQVINKKNINLKQQKNDLEQDFSNLMQQESIQDPIVPDLINMQSSMVINKNNFPREQQKQSLEDLMDLFGGDLDRP